MPMFLKKLIELFISKQKIIGWVAAPLFVLGAGAVGMQNKEFKDSVCGVELPKQDPPPPAMVAEPVVPEVKK